MNPLHPLWLAPLAILAVLAAIVGTVCLAVSRRRRGKRGTGLVILAGAITALVLLAAAGAVLTHASRTYADAWRPSHAWSRSSIELPGPAATWTIESRLREPSPLHLPSGSVLAVTAESGFEGRLPGRGGWHEVRLSRGRVLRVRGL